MARTADESHGGTAGSRIMELLTCRTEELAAAGAIVLHAKGEVDLSTAPRLLDALEPAVRKNRHVVVDLNEVDYFDGSGFRVLETCQRLARERGRQLVVAAPPASRARRLFRLLRLDQVIRVFPSVAEAVRGLGS